LKARDESPATVPPAASATATSTPTSGTAPTDVQRSLARALEALYARVPLGMRLGLDAMNVACTRADHPERSFEVAHIGGTNGKGSTCAMLEAILLQAGYRTGVYTSPHLVHFQERCRLRGEVVSLINARTTTIGMPTSTSPPSSDFHQTRAAAWSGSD
jgi:dihydrofolate synthase/folylpolyglutamate synthase